MKRRVLVVQPYGIGDLLFLTPVLRALRVLPTVEKVDLLLGSRTDAVLRGNPHVDEIMVVNKDLFHKQGKWKTFSDVRALTAKLADKKYDLLLDYSLRGEYAFLSQFFLGIRRRAGFDYKHRGFFHSIRMPLAGGFKGRHVVDYVCDLAEKAGVPVRDRHLEFYMDPKDREEARARLTRVFEPRARILAIAPGGGESWGKDAHFKRWPAPFFAQLAEKLHEFQFFDGAIILGSGGESDLGAAIAEHLKMPVLDLCGKTSLGVTAAIMGKSAVFLGNDGGLMHLAHALQVPLAALFGPSDPIVYGPYPSSREAVVVTQDLECRPCYQKFRYNSACAKRECLQELTPEEAWSTMLAKNFLSQSAGLKTV